MPATAAILASMIDVIPLSDLDLSTINVPFLVFAGELDVFYEGAKRSASHLPQSKFVSLPDLDHTPAFACSDLMLPYIKDFLAQTSKP